MRIAVIYDKFREDTLGEHYKKALIQEGDAVEHFWLKDSHKIQPVFDAYLRIDDGDYKYDIPHERLAPAFFYASDTHLKKPFLAIKRISRFYVHIFCAQHSGYVKLKRIYGNKVSWLPHACDDVGAGLKPAPTKRELDIAFVGNDGGIPRKFLLQEMRERYPNSHIGNAPHTDIARIYSSAKIGFNYSIANDINMRMFEVMSCGAMLLTNRIKDEGFNILFGDEDCLEEYNSPKEMFSMIEYYLRNDAERERLAQAGRRLVAERHNYMNRVRHILEVIKAYKDR